MSHAKLIGLLLLGILLPGGQTLAQQSGPAKDDARVASPEQQKKAIDLLKNVADQIGTLQSAENRARFGSNLAASLWKHDEQRARMLLASVQTEISSELQKVDEDDATNKRNRLVFSKLRLDTAERIAKMDAEVALAFLKATEVEIDLTKFPQLAEMTRTMELQLANQIAAENPEFALKLGRSSLAGGFSHELEPLLRRLLRKDHEKARILYNAIVEKLVSAGLTPYSPAFYLAQNLAHSFRPPKISEEAYRKLIDLFRDTASGQDCGKRTEDDPLSHFCRELMSVVRLDRSVAASAGDPSTPKESEVPDVEYGRGLFEEVEDIADSGTVKEMIDLAQKYRHEEIQQMVYARAALMAAEAGDIDQARKIVTTHIPDPEVRTRVTDELDKFALWQTITAERMAEIQQTVSGIPAVKSKVGFLLEMSHQIGSKDRKSGLKLLKQAAEMIETMKPGRERTEAEIGLAMLYCQEKDERGFSIMQSLLPKLNDLISAAVKLDGYESDNIREGEWNMSGSGSIGSLLTLMSQGAGYFAWSDFDRAASLASQFERTELRLMAQMKLAQAILAGPPRRQLSRYITYRGIYHQ